VAGIRGPYDAAVVWHFEFLYVDRVRRLKKEPAEKGAAKKVPTTFSGGAVRRMVPADKGANHFFRGNLKCSQPLESATSTS
jgi:hypothetical protein